MSKKQSTNILSAIGYISSLLLLFGVILSFIYGSYNMGFGLLGVMVILLVCVWSLSMKWEATTPPMCLLVAKQWKSLLSHVLPARLAML